MTLIADIGLEVAIYKVDKGCLEITLIPWSGGKTTIPSFQMFGNQRGAFYQHQLLQDQPRGCLVQLPTFLTREEHALLLTMQRF